MLLVSQLLHVWVDSTVHSTNKPLNQSLKKQQHTPLFYKIRTKGESETQSYRGVWIFASISEMQPGAIWKVKLKTGLFASFSCKEWDVTAMGVEEQQRRKTVKRCCGVDLTRRYGETDERGITSSPHCQIQQESSFCSIKQLELWPSMTGSVCSVSSACPAFLQMLIRLLLTADVSNFLLPQTWNSDNSDFCVAEDQDA